MNKFAPHFQRFTTEMRDLIAEWKPPLVVWVDPNPYGIEEIRRVSPYTFIVGRKNEEGGWNSPDLRARAYYWADECARMGPCDAYYVWNEPISHDDVDNFGRLDDFHIWFRERILTYGIEAVGLNVGTGNFTLLDDIAECFPKTCASFKHIGIHEYDWIIDPAKRPVDSGRLGYYWDRWPYWLEDIGMPSELGGLGRYDVTLWVTECGMTQAVHAGRPDEGWRSGADGMTDDDYIAWADWYNRQLVKDARMGGAALFNFAGYGWETFEHMGWGRLGEILALDAPNGGNDMDIRVIDINRNVLTGQAAQDLIDFHGYSFQHPSNLSNGDHYYKLVELEEKEGPAAFIFTVLDIDGNPVGGAMTAWRWTGFPADANDIEQSYPTDWYDMADVAPTKEDGKTGPQMTTDWYTGPNEPGPGQAWIRHSQMWATCVMGIGMIAGTNHRTLNGTWQETVWGEGPTPPPDDVAEQIIYHADEIKKWAMKIDGGGSPTEMTLAFPDGTRTYELTEV